MLHFVSERSWPVRSQLSNIIIKIKKSGVLQCDYFNIFSSNFSNYRNRFWMPGDQNKQMYYRWVEKHNKCETKLNVAIVIMLTFSGIDTFCPKQGIMCGCLFCVCVYQQHALCDCHLLLLPFTYNYQWSIGPQPSHTKPSYFCYHLQLSWCPPSIIHLYL